MNLSAHFTKAELACPHCGLCPIKSALLEALEELRTACGDRALTVLSGYRCPEHNAAVGGEPNSKHCLGQAADVAVPAGMDLDAMYQAACKVNAFKHGGIGLYPAGRGQVHAFIHVDVRLDRARWARIDGKYVSIDKAVPLKEDSA